VPGSSSGSPTKRSPPRLVFAPGNSEASRRAGESTTTTRSSPAAQRYRPREQGGFAARSFLGRREKNFSGRRTRPRGRTRALMERSLLPAREENSPGAHVILGSLRPRFVGDPENKENSRRARSAGTKQIIFASRFLGDPETGRTARRTKNRGAALRSEPPDFEIFRAIWEERALHSLKLMAFGRVR
jgi:hypothetical protein